RFIARRGSPESVLSYNASQFQLIFKTMKEQDIKLTNFFARKGMVWENIVPRVPRSGGVYERIIGLTKNAMERAIGRKVLNQHTKAKQEEPITRRTKNATRNRIPEATPVAVYTRTHVRIPAIRCNNITRTKNVEEPLNVFIVMQITKVRLCSSPRKTVSEEDFIEIEKSSPEKLKVVVTMGVEVDSGNKTYKMCKEAMLVSPYEREKSEKALILLDLVKSEIKTVEFDGNPKLWSLFIKQFEEAIDEREDMTATRKFAHLLGFLKGEALVHISDLAVNEENYILAMKNLKERYGDKQRRILELYTILQKLDKSHKANEANGNSEEYARELPTRMLKQRETSTLTFGSFQNAKVQTEFS
ncbi:unnamed protein product, partial [Onchocerca ochengi]